MTFRPALVSTTLLAALAVLAGIAVADPTPTPVSTPAPAPKTESLIGPSVFTPVTLEKPVKMELVPVVEGPLLRGEVMQFSLRIEGAPEPIHMWSARIDYTSDTLSFDKIIASGRTYETVISDGYKMAPEFESRSIAGMSLTGLKDGEIMRLQFRVAKDAKVPPTIALEKHPIIRETMSHDDMKLRKIFDYQRELVATRTKAMTLADVDATHQPYKFPVAPPRVVYQKPTPTP